MAFAAAPLLLSSRVRGANDRLDIAVIGPAGRGAENLKEVSGENIVAICDVDARNLAAASVRHPGARTIHDFRRLLDLPGIDAVVVSTPDHTHAVAAAGALRSGRHVYCEKPLARTVSEVRRITQLAREHRRVTQIGTQIHAGSNYRRVVEWVRSGAIGVVDRVHVWVAATYGGESLPLDQPPVPAALDYDLWLGPVKPVPYHPKWVPFAWRNWWAFGGGALADFGCHYMDLPFWALGLKHPEHVEVMDGPPVQAHSAPPWLVVRYRFGAAASHGPVHLTWYHGGRRPEVLPPEYHDTWKSGVLFMGSKGMVLADYGRHLLLPETRFRDQPAPSQTIAASVGHHREWIEACKGRGTTSCGFDYSGPLSEAALLGNVAYRAGQSLDWRSWNLRATNTRAAEEFIRHDYRAGWSI